MTRPGAHMDAPKRYTIRTIEDIGQIPAERLDAFLEDLRASLLLSRTSGKVADTLLKGVSPQLQGRCTLMEMEWVDDGEHDIRPQFNGKPAPAIPGPQVPRVLHGFAALADHLQANSVSR